MKRICKCFLGVLFLIAAALAISSCGGIKQLKTPENLRIENEILSWDAVENAKEYLVEANDMTFQIKEASFDLFETILEPDDYKIRVTAVGDLEKYSDSERSEGIEYAVQSAEGIIACAGYWNHGECSITGRGAKDFVGKLVIPSMIEEGQVTGIVENAFRDCKNLTAVYIPDSVLSIGQSAFSHCTNLARVRLSENIRKLYFKLFYRSGIIEIKLPANLTEINGSAFQNCFDLERIEVAEENLVYRSEGNCVISKKTNAVVIGCKASVIPQGVEIISATAFDYCEGLTEIFIPANVTLITSNPFGGAKNLERIEVAAGNPVYRSEGNCVIRKEDNAVVVGCKTSVIPQGVKAIGDYVFEHLDSVTSIEIPDSVTEIGNFAFNGCTGLTAITIPDSVTEIGNSAFNGCTGLTAITIPDSVTEIGYSAFEECTGLTELTLGDGVTIIGAKAFFGCNKLIAVTIPRSVQSIGSEAFADCYACFTVPASLKEYIREFDGSAVYTDAEAKSGEITWPSTIYGCQLGYDGDSPYVISWEHKLWPTIIPGIEKPCITAGGTRTPARAGYEFLGWATEEGGEVVYAAQDVIWKFGSSSGRPSNPTTSYFRKVVRVAIYEDDEFNSLALDTVLYAVWRPLE